MAAASPRHENPLAAAGGATRLDLLLLLLLLSLLLLRLLLRLAGALAETEI